MSWTTPTTAPLSSAQASASRQVSSGSWALVGGWLPVAAFQVPSRTFLVTSVAAPTATPPTTFSASASEAFDMLVTP